MNEEKLSNQNDMGFEDNKSYHVTITKVIDDAFDGKHPNGINEGYSKVGITHKKPTVGECFFVFSNTYFRTSTVTEIVDSTTFKTLNSTYKILELKEVNS